MKKWLSGLRKFRKSSSVVAETPSSQTDTASTSTLVSQTLMDARQRVALGATLSQLQIFRELIDERVRQNRKHGPVPLTRESGCSKNFEWLADQAKQRTDRASAFGGATWKDILEEEIWEAYAEEDWELCRAELIQVAAVAISWIEDSDLKFRDEKKNPVQVHPFL